MSRVVERWFVEFELEEPKLFPEMKLPSDIILRTNSENKVTIIQVVVVDTWKKIEEIAKERIKKFETILSIKLDFRFNYTYRGWYKKEGDIISGRQIVGKTLVLKSSVESKAKSKLDLERLLSSGDAAYWRQMGHFAKGMKSIDPVEKYRELCQMVEDEGNLITEDERALRHAVNHPYLTHSKTVGRVMSIFSSPFFDPMKEEHTKIVLKYANEMEKKARAILKNK